MASIHDPHATPQKVLPRPERIVLQIEDNPANAEVVRLLLERRSDLKLRTATDGRQGIEMACLLQPDVILLDMRLPGMSGLEVMPILRMNPATAHIPVIALSSNAYPNEITKCLDAGVFRYLTKPYKIDNLMATIDAALHCASEKHLANECRDAISEAAVAQSCGAMPPIPSGAAGRIRP